MTPDSFPARRGRDRAGVDEKRLLLISLGGEHARDVEAWARASFQADIVSEPFEAVARVQGDASYGGVLVHAPRARVREAVQACRAIRPLTRAAIVFASDDAVRSTDRIQVLEAGADDCLSGGIDFRELDLRIKQAIASGSEPPAPRKRENGEAPHATPKGGRVDLEAFTAELQRRAVDPLHSFFCVLGVADGRLSPADLEELLTEQVRCDEGDLVSPRNGDGCYVLLHGAREAQLGPFLNRLRARIGEAGGNGPADVELAVLSHPADSAKIQKLLGIEGAAEG